MSAADFVFKADIVAGEPQEGVAQYPFVGVASSTSLDRQGDRITEKCLVSMSEQVPMVLAVAPSHAQAVVDVMAEAGTITAFKVEGGDLQIAGELDPRHPNAEFLWGKMQEGSQKLSIAGHVPKEAHRSVWDVTLSKHVGEIDAIELDHVLLCRSSAAVNQDTSIVAQATGDWVDAIFKAAGDVVKAELPEDMSHDDLLQLIYVALDEIIGGYGAWVVDVFENTVVVEVAGKYHRYGYSLEGEKVVLGEAEEVEQKWVATEMAKAISAEPSLTLVTNMGKVLTSVVKVTADRDIRGRTLNVLVEDLLKADALSGIPDGEGRIMDAIDKMAAALEGVVSGAKASAPPKDPSASIPETAEEPQVEAEKADGGLPPELIEFMQQSLEMMKSIEGRVAALEAPVVETEKAEEPTVEEPVVVAPEAEKAEEPTPAEDTGEETAVNKVTEALGLIVTAIKELQTDMAGLKAANGEQESRLATIEKASPVSAQVTTPNTNPSETVAGDSQHPIHDLLMGSVRV